MIDDVLLRIKKKLEWSTVNSGYASPGLEGDFKVANEQDQ